MFLRPVCVFHLRNLSRKPGFGSPTRSPCLPHVPGGRFWLLSDLSLSIMKIISFGVKLLMALGPEECTAVANL